MPKSPGGASAPLAIPDAVILVVGVVIGAGIFRTPSVVASSVGSPEWVILLWAAGGLVSLLGALCYAELTSAFPDAGGEYHYLTRAFGGATGFLFAWARMTVIQTGSIAMLAFLIGDYLSGLYRIGSRSPSVYAAIVVVLLTVVNVAGLRQGKNLQRLLLGGLLVGLLALVAAGMVSDPAPSAEPSSPLGAAAIGHAMVFVLLTYGGWNEAAYLSSEVGRARRNMLWVLLLSVATITLVYLAVNLALLRGLGIEAMSGSSTVAADLMRTTLGENGARFISVLVVLAAFSTMNATIITGARTAYALGRDFSLLRFLGRWRERRSTPANALFVQGTVAVALVGLGTASRSGFETMVAYTAPAFWFFFLMTGISLITLRWREPEAARPFRVPLYPFVPLAFCAVCLYMLYSSLAYTGFGALVGVGALLSGVPLLFAALTRQGRGAHEE